MVSDHGLALRYPPATPNGRRARYFCRCGEVAEWLKAPVSKTGIPLWGIAGSNPALSAILHRKCLLPMAGFYSFQVEDGHIYVLGNPPISRGIL